MAPHDASPRLNYDILLNVMSFCDLSTASRFMRTCSTLYQGGAKVVLDCASHKIVDEQLFWPFCLFLVIGKGRRIRHLRYLTLSLAELSEEEAKILTTILSRAKNLAELTLFSPEALLSSHRDLADVISELKGLRRLNVRSGGQVTCEVIRRMKAPLVWVDFSYDHDFGDEPFWEVLGKDSEEAMRYHPTILFSSFSQTLEELDMDDWERSSAPSQQHTAVYPKLRRLVLSQDYPITRAYIRSFPALTKLSVHLPAEEWDRNLEENLDVLESHRRENLGDQLESGTWSRLKEYKGSILSLFLLGLTCRIHHLKLQCFDAWQLRLLKAVLERAKPVVLEVNLNGEAFSATTPSFMDVLRERRMSSLSHLSLDVELSRGDEALDVQGLMEDLKSALAHPNLKSVWLCVRPSPGGRLNPTPLRMPRVVDDPDDPDGVRLVPASPPPPPPLVPAELALQEFDEVGYARAVAAAVPSLKSAAVVVEGPRKQGIRVARLTRGEGGEVTLVEERKKWIYEVARPYDPQ